MKHFALINDFIYFRYSNFLFTSCHYLERGTIFIIPMSTPLMNFASIVKINTFQNVRLLFVVARSPAGIFLKIDDFYDFQGDTLV